METHYFFDGRTGDYIGGFSGQTALAQVPSDAIEVPNPPNDGRDRLDLKTGQIVPYAPGPTPEDIAAGLEAKFLAMVPAHQGQPYFTPDVILRIMQTKAAVDAAIKIDPTGTFAMAAISAVQLPPEMNDSRKALLNDLSQLLGG